MSDQEIPIDALDVLATLKMSGNNVAAGSINSGYLLDGGGNIHRVVKGSDDSFGCMQCSFYSDACPTGVTYGECILEDGFVFAEMS